MTRFDLRYLLSERGIPFSQHTAAGRDNLIGHVFLGREGKHHPAEHVISGLRPFALIGQRHLFARVQLDPRIRNGHSPCITPVLIKGVNDQTIPRTGFKARIDSSADGCSPVGDAY